MSLEAVILQEIKKLQNNPQDGGNIPPLGFIQKLPEAADTLSVLDATFQKTGTLKDLTTQPTEYPEALAYLMPKNSAVTAFPTQTFSQGSVACSDDTIVFTKSSSGATGQLYVASQSTNFVFQLKDLPIAAQFYACYEKGVFFFLPYSGSTIVYSTDNLATFKTLATGTNSLRIVRSYYQPDGNLRFVLIPFAQSSNSNVGICQLDQGTLSYINTLTIPTTYLVDMAWDPVSDRWFYVRQSGGPMYSASLGVGLTSLVTSPPSFSGITVSTSTVAVSDFPGQIQYFNRRIILPLAGPTNGTFISVDPTTLQAELMQDSVGTSSQRLWLSNSGKVLYTRVSDISPTIKRWVTTNKQAPTQISVSAATGFGSFSDKLGAWKAAATDPNIYKTYHIYGGAVIYEPNQYVRVQ